MILYFDHLPLLEADRTCALDLALEVLRPEPDKPTVMQLNDMFGVCRCSMRIERHRYDRPDRIRGET